MGWSAFVFGELNFPSEGLARWHAMPADPAEFDDWDEEFFVDFPDGPPTVAELLSSLADIEGADASPDFFDVTQDGGSVKLRGYIGEETYGELSTHLATAARLAARSGGQGELYLSDFQAIDFAWRIRVEDGKSRVERVADPEALMARDEVEEIMTRAGQVAGHAKSSKSAAHGTLRKAKLVTALRKKSKRAKAQPRKRR
jgi:hypothetical protein